MAAVSNFLLGGQARLVTLTGPGGVGKTRLAIETARSISEEFRDGVRFISLATLTEPGAVLPAIARSLGILERGEVSLVEQIASTLHNRQLLLVIDNFEHLPQAAPELAAVLGMGPTGVMLVTSRSRLRISGEWEYEVGPLALSHQAEAKSLDPDAHSEAVQLFAQRASAADFSFSLSESNLAAVVAICRRLDGLPLAIELAAARVRFLPPLAMLDHLKNNLPVLKGGVWICLPGTGP